MDESALADAMAALVTARAAEDGISISELARRTGTGQPTMMRRLRGELKVTVDQWEAIAVALGWRDLEELLGEARRTM